MLTSYSIIKKQLISVANKHCQNYLTLHQQLTTSFNNLPNDDYYIGTGLDLEEEPAEERLTNQFISTIAHIKRCLASMPLLTKDQINDIDKIMYDAMYKFFKAPSQKKIELLEVKLSLALDELFPSTTVLNLFQPEKKQAHEVQQPMHSLLYDQGAIEHNPAECNLM